MSHLLFLLYIFNITIVIAREIDRTKTNYLKRNHIHCIKKPISDYQLRRIIKRIRDDDYLGQMGPSLLDQAAHLIQPEFERRRTLGDKHQVPELNLSKALDLSKANL